MNFNLLYPGRKIKNDLFFEQAERSLKGLPFVAVLRPSEMFKLVFQLGMFPEETLLYIDKRTFYLVSFFGLKTSSEKQRILKGDIKEELKKLLSNQNLSKIRCGVV
jgi:hypothetical protein